MFWKIFDKVGTAAFWILGPIAGLVILVVWLFQPSEADFKAAIEDVEKSEYLYNMAVLNHADRQLSGLDSKEPTPCEIYHKVIYYINKKVFEASALKDMNTVYDFSRYSCSRTEAPKKYRIKKKEKDEQPKKSKNKNAILSEDEVVVVLGELVKTFGLSGSEIDKLKKKLASCTTAECLEDITTELQSKSPSITQEPMTEEELRKKWEGSKKPSQIDIRINNFKSKYGATDEELRVLRKFLESCNGGNDCMDMYEYQIKQAMEADRKAQQPVVEDKGEFIEVPKAIDVEPEPEMVKTQQEDTPIRKGDCSDPTFLKYTQMYDNGIMGRIEYQDFVYTNNFDKCF